MSLISAKDLTIGFSDLVLYRDLSFEINEGDYVFVIGENGTGKTTLMRTLLGLRKPLKGEVVTDGLKLSEIGYLPQQTIVQRDFPASVKEIVLSGFVGRLGINPFYSAAQKKKALDAMKRFGVENLASRCYRELSGGQQQRVLLARTLCAATKVLLMDEPVAGLDPFVTEEFYGLVEKLNREGMTIIMISHDIAAAKKYATHILHIKNDPSFTEKKEYFASGKGNEFSIVREKGEV
ncbi:MAG: ABC transporter ATP-binding protein [Oscillospiraceae bacterium]|nr:ABC transporter ATP-binding protein [Oscillospiraceae bacterium]